MSSSIFGGKPWYESLTAWGVILISVLEGVEAAGLVPPGLGESVIALGQSLGGVLAVLGIRKAATAPNTK